MNNEECKYKIYLPLDIVQKHLAGKPEYGEWSPCHKDTKAICLATPGEAAKVYQHLRSLGIPEITEAVGRSEDSLNWHLQD